MLPERFIENIESRPDSVSDDDLQAFSNWINDELKSILGDRLDEDRLAALHVAMIAGGRVIGQGQNEGGEIAVAMLKQALVDHFGPEDAWDYQSDEAKNWNNAGVDLAASLALLYGDIEEAERSSIFTPAVIGQTSRPSDRNRQ